MTDFLAVAYALRWHLFILAVLVGTSLGYEAALHRAQNRNRP